MRRLNDISIEVDDRMPPPQARRGAAPAKGAGAARGGRPARPRRWLAFGLRKRTQHALLGVTIAVFGLGLPAWLIASGTAGRLAEGARQQVLALSARAGFRVEDILVEGRSRTPREQLLSALQVRRGDPIFGIDLSATRQRLEEISWVKTATIERRLPGEVHLLITERAPVVLWQSQGRYYLVDHDGQVVGDEIDEYGGLPLMVGEGAPDHAGELVDLLDTEPTLKQRVKAAQWVGERRWTLTLDRTSGGIDIRLPEDDPLAAWHELAELERDQSLLERKVSLIDMRLPDRLILRATGAEESVNPAGQTKRKPHPGKDA